MTTHRTPTRDTSDSREAPAAQAAPAQELSDAQDAAEWRQIGIDVYVRRLKAAEQQIATLTRRNKDLEQRLHRVIRAANERIAEHVRGVLRGAVAKHECNTAKDKVATLTAALHKAGEALREEVGGWTRASAKAANIIEVALAAVRGEPKP